MQSVDEIKGDNTMLTINMFRQAEAVTYYFTVEESSPNAWYCAHTDEPDTPYTRFKIYAVSENYVPDLGTMPRVVNWAELPLALRRDLDEHLAGQEWQLAMSSADHRFIGDGEGFDDTLYVRPLMGCA